MTENMDIELFVDFLYLEFLHKKVKLPLKCVRHILARHSGKKRNAENSIFLEDVVFTLKRAAEKTNAEIRQSEGRIICDVDMEKPVGYRQQCICHCIRIVIGKRKNVIITAYPVWPDFYWKQKQPALFRATTASKKFSCRYVLLLSWKFLVAVYFHVVKIQEQ